MTSTEIRDVNPPLIDIVKERKRNADGVCPCGFHVSGDEETNVDSVSNIQGNRQNLSQDKNYFSSSIFLKLKTSRWSQDHLLTSFKLESLILAQNERWRQA
jgi:hypothetical protein